MICTKPWLFWLLFPFFLSGCASLYIPNALPTPDLQEAGDANLNLSFGLGESFLLIPYGTSFDLQGAVAVTDHIGILGNFSTLIDFSEPEYRSKHLFAEGGIGWFGDIGTDLKKEKSKYAFAYSGYGFGKAEDRHDYDFSNDDDLYTGNYQRFFLMPGIGFRSSWVDGGFAGRLAFVHFANYKERQNGQVIEESSFNFATFEPVGYLGLGGEKVKFYLQAGLTIPLEGGDPDESNFYKVANDISSVFHFHMGVRFLTFKQEPGVLVTKQKTGQLTINPSQHPVILLEQPNIRICLQEPGQPDGDVIAVHFNSALVLDNFTLQDEPECFEITLGMPGDNTLQVSGITDGVFTPNTVEVAIWEGNEEHVFFIKTQAGRTEELILKVR